MIKDDEDEHQWREHARGVPLASVSHHQHLLLEKKASWEVGGGENHRASDLLPESNGHYKVNKYF